MHKVLESPYRNYIVCEFKAPKTARLFLYPVASVHRHHGEGDYIRFSLFLTSPRQIARFFLVWRVCARQAARAATFFILAPASYGFKCKFRVCRTRPTASVDHPRILLDSDLRKNSSDGRPDRMIRMVAWTRSCK